MLTRPPVPGFSQRAARGTGGSRSFSDFEQRAGRFAPPLWPNPKTGTLSLKSGDGARDTLPLFPAGRLGRQGQGPSRGPPAFGARLPACRGEERRVWYSRPDCPLPHASARRRSPAHSAKKAAAGAAQAARRGGERGAAGAGTAPALSAAHLPTPHPHPSRCPRGRSRGVPRIYAGTEGLPPPARWDSPRPRVTNCLPRSLEPMSLERTGLKQLRIKQGDLVFRKEAGGSLSPFPPVCLPLKVASRFLGI